MEIKEILKEFRRTKGYFPQEAINAAIERREEITPYLLAIVEEGPTKSSNKEITLELTYALTILSL